MDVFRSALLALENIGRPETLAFLCLGVLVGLVIGVIPGLGGLVGLSLLLPLTLTMDPVTAIAFMIGLQAVTVTSDTIPAVLFGVPGTVGSAATILDGHPMARKGLAERAFGAAFSASVVGGLFGALVLGASIVVIYPVILAVGSPELLAICVFGLSLVAVLSGGSPLKGMTIACVGLLLATIGEEAQTGTFRWTFDSMYLWDGLPIVPLALGLFAIPELADLCIMKTSVSSDSAVKRAGFGKFDGVRDTLRHWFLVLRCSIIGSTLGAVPGIGASVIDWIAYGHAKRTEKGANESFGKGDVRGVIASEASNNAKEGGALIPTIAFGVPGSASMALILGVFLIHGIIPGPEMLTKHLSITYTLVWSVAIANVIGAGMCFLFADQLAKIALVRIGILAPVIIAITFVGAFQGSSSWGDIYALLAFGFLGWVMKRLRWSRPPLMLGFVLGGLIEQYMSISVNRYGVDWLWIWKESGSGAVTFSPYVTIILTLTVLSILAPIVKKYLEKKRSGESKVLQFGFRMESLRLGLVFPVLLVVLFCIVLYVSSGWAFSARLGPVVIATVGLVLVFGHLVGSLCLKQKSPESVSDKGKTKHTSGAGVHLDIGTDYLNLSETEVLKRFTFYFSWLVAFLGMGHVFGLLPATLLFLIFNMRFAGREGWKTIFLVVIPVWSFAYGVFHVILAVPWPQTIVGNLFPSLRSVPWLNRF